jgi:hypothetical protein
MTRNFLSLLFVALTFSLFPQKAMTFQQAEKSGVRASKLDSVYPSGLHVDSMQSVFHHRQDEFIAAYQKMLQDLGKYLKANGFTWGKPTAGFNRIYFNGNGTIDYFLYNFKKGEITEEKEKQFDALLNKFIKTYQFPMKAKTGFAQCSPVRYMN